MELLYRGFDGLDVSFRAHLPSELLQKLDDAKAAAQTSHGDVLLQWNKVSLLVAESGARGGYAFRASTSEFGATWFFKRPNAGDGWGIRASCGSFQLANNGLARTRMALTAFLESLGVDVVDGQESIGRVDYAVDFLAPEFLLDPSAFVMHSNSIRADHYDNSDITTHGASGRTTSVTVGKMPGRQVIVYDKRAEIIAHRKPAWWAIWNATRSKNGLPDLETEVAERSRVWRVELRAGKRFLKERWKITSWRDLEDRYGDVIASILEAVRHTNPTQDTNRSRWPNSALWDSTTWAANEDLFEMRNHADPNLVKRVQREEFCRTLARQMDGLAVSMAAVSAVPIENLPEFAVNEGKRMADRMKQASDHYASKYASTLVRYEVDGSP